MKKLKVVGIFARTKFKINFAKTTPISQKTPLQQNMYDKYGGTTFAKNTCVMAMNKCYF